jgi:alpha-aminoadipic semialdehyde synthase
MHLRRVSFALPLGRSTFRFYTSQTAPVTIGIRREDPGRIWERRAPLTPDTVAELVGRDNVRVLIQECERRVFPLEEYVHVRTICCIYVRGPELITEHVNITQAGAEVHSTLEPAHLVLGIKETPLHSLITSPVRSV